MHVPPPPPALAPPPPTFAFALANTEKPVLNAREQQNRNALLSDITKGTRLKKTVTNDHGAPIFNKPEGGRDRGGGGGGGDRFGGSWSVSPPSHPTGAQSAGPRPFGGGGNSASHLPVPQNDASDSPHPQMTPPCPKTPSGLPPPVSNSPRPNQSTLRNRGPLPFPRRSWPPGSAPAPPAPAPQGCQAAPPPVPPAGLSCQSSFPAPPPPVSHSSRPLLPPGPNRATEDLPPFVPVSNGPSLPLPRDSLPPPPLSFNSKTRLPPPSSASSWPPSNSPPPGLPALPPKDETILCFFLTSLSPNSHAPAPPPGQSGSVPPPPPKSQLSLGRDASGRSGSPPPPPGHPSGSNMRALPVPPPPSCPGTETPQGDSRPPLTPDSPVAGGPTPPPPPIGTGYRSLKQHAEPEGGRDRGGGGGGGDRFGGSWSVSPPSHPTGAQSAGPRPFGGGGNSASHLPVPQNDASDSPHPQMTPPCPKTPSGLPPPVSSSPRPNQSTLRNRGPLPFPRRSWPPGSAPAPPAPAPQGCQAAPPPVPPAGLSCQSSFPAPPPPVSHSSRPPLPPGPNRATEDLPPFVPVSNGPSLPLPRDSLPPPPLSFNSKTRLPPPSSASSRPPSNSPPPGLPALPPKDETILCFFLTSLSPNSHAPAPPPGQSGSVPPPPPKSQLSLGRDASGRSGSPPPPPGHPSGSNMRALPVPPPPSCPGTETPQGDSRPPLTPDSPVAGGPTPPPPPIGTGYRSLKQHAEPEGGRDRGGGGGGGDRFGGSWSVSPPSHPTGAQSAGPRPFGGGGNSAPHLPVPQNDASDSPHPQMTPPCPKTPSGLPPPVSNSPRPNQSTLRNRGPLPFPRRSWPPGSAPAPPAPAPQGCQAAPPPGPPVGLSCRSSFPAPHPAVSHSSRPLLPPGPNRATEDPWSLVPVSSGPSLPLPRDSLLPSPPPSFIGKPPLPPSPSALSRPPSNSAPPGLPAPPSTDQSILYFFLTNLSLNSHATTPTPPPGQSRTLTSCYTL